MVVVMEVVMEGPLAPWASGLAEQLNGLGYSRRTAGVQMALAGKLSRFLEQRAMGVVELRTDRQVVRQSLVERIAAPTGGTKQQRAALLRMHAPMLARPRRR
jgi:hypothetical protein